MLAEMKPDDGLTIAADLGLGYAGINPELLTQQVGLEEK
jgi:hypothetical protein